MQNVDRSKIRSYVENEIENLLNDLDPRSRSKSIVVKRNIRPKNADFPGYPVIVLQDVSLEETNRNLDNQTVFYRVSSIFRIESPLESGRDKNFFKEINDKIHNLTVNKNEIKRLQDKGFLKFSIDRDDRSPTVMVQQQPVTRHTWQIGFDMQIDFTEAF